MRLPTLLTVPVLLTSLSAQQFSEEQRAELRRIIREEIRAVMQEVRGTPAGVPAEQVVEEPAEEVVEEIVEPEFTDPPRRIVLEGGAAQRGFEWSTVAPDVTVQKAETLRKVGDEKTRYVKPKLRGLELTRQADAPRLLEVRPQIETDRSVILHVDGSVTECPALIEIEAPPEAKVRKSDRKKPGVTIFTIDGAEYEVINLGGVRAGRIEKDEKQADKKQAEQECCEECVSEECCQEGKAGKASKAVECCEVGQKPAPPAAAPRNEGKRYDSRRKQAERKTGTGIWLLPR